MAFVDERTAQSIGKLNSHKETLNRLNGPGKRLSTMNYPSDIDTDGNKSMILFNINISEGTNLTDISYANEANPENIPVYQRDTSNSLLSKARAFNRYRRITDSIVLYMPSSLATTYSVDWAGKELGVVGGISKASGTSIDDLTNTSGLFRRFSEGVQSLVASSIDQVTPLNINDSRNLLKTQIKNPYMEVLFNGVNNREFNFQFKFTPRSEQEAKEVQRIIQTFKLHQAPEYAFANEGLEAYLLYPSNFDITFLFEGQRNPYIHRISTCGLKSIDINYDTDGGFRTFKNGAPVQTNMTLSFIEMEIITKRSIKEGF